MKSIFAFTVLLLAPLADIRAADPHLDLSAPGAAKSAASPTIQPASKQNAFVFNEPGRYGGWPANHGLWQWGDELVAGFEVCWFKHATNDHAVDRSKPFLHWQARSRDGGLTWKVEDQLPFADPKLEKKPVPLTSPLDFTAPGFAMMFRMGSMHVGPSWFYVSDDRCRTWRGPFAFAVEGIDKISTRTDLVVLGPRDCLMFGSAAKSDNKEGRVFCARTVDGGLTWKLVSLIGPEPADGFAIMPSTVRLPGGALVTTIRNGKPTYDITVWRSDDVGRTWTALGAATGDIGGNPPALVRLQDGRLCLTYGYRRKPCGVRARLSADDGRTWGPEIILRDDGLTGDLGYPRSLVRPDGKVLTVYYFNGPRDEDRTIQATLWTPPPASAVPAANADPMAADFARPPAEARPWVYWMFMDGNLTREGITADLEAMQRAGIGGVIILEVNIGIPRGTVEFMSALWRELIAHAVREADRLGLEISLGAGPGWCGTGGPWVKPEQSMQHLVSSETHVTGPKRLEGPLPQPQPRIPFFGEKTLPPDLHKIWKEFYRDEFVLAFSTPSGDYRIPDVDEKALYHRAPYSSQPGVKPLLSADPTILPPEQCIAREKIIELKLTDGRLAWDVPPGEWTIMRFGRTITGQTTRPAPTPGLGFESDKFDKSALDAHFASFVGELLKTVGQPRHPGRGLTTVHFDSWEMSSQNWSPHFREEFQKRRGYDPLRFLPAMAGRVVESVETSERFLWDLRRTAQELVIENHAGHLKELGRRNGLSLSIEPYDLNPAGDLALGGVADVPMCEFWSKGYGFSTEFSASEAVSIAHTMGRPIVGAEAFTSHADAWRQHPGSMKQQGDWALAAGINRFVFHRYQHQPWTDRFPGMTFGPYGVHWDRTETWWEMVPAYHAYLARCQAMLRRGLPVADILYLDAEGAPDVFRQPGSATLGGFPDRRGYNFDGCSPGALIERAAAQDGRIVFPNGMSYRLLVLPQTGTMTPALLRKIKQLVDAGATVVGSPPKRSPSLENYPACDNEVRQLAAEIWRGDRVILTEDPPPDAAPENALANAKWIWHNEGRPAAQAPVGQRFFRREVEIAGNVASAMFIMTADNSFTLFVNAREAGSGANFHEHRAIDVAPLLKPGKNVVTVTVENGGDAPNPAGLIGALVVRFQDGRPMALATDRQWTSSLAPDGPMQPALELGVWNMAPWKLGPPAAKFPDIYPSYETAARILAEKTVSPDFESDADLRYSHRRDGDVDLYFVGNRTAAMLDAECRFRVVGRVPELWDPLTGSRRPLPEFREQDGRTIVPLRFEPSQSFFVVFGRGPRATGVNFPPQRQIAELTGPWSVHFDPKWGGPEQATFASLDDWSKRPEDGIRFYSGIATYRKKFTAPAAKPGERQFLDLGNVAVMASVAINGHDCGAVWTSPYRVEITVAAKPGENALDIRVANRWPNRLIGDAGLPPEKRSTFTTWSPYQKSSPLLESGLFGPVRVLVEESAK